MSFDASMNATKCGDTFIATIQTLSESSALYRVGFRLGDKVLCEKNIDTVVHVKAHEGFSGCPWLAVKGSTEQEVESLVLYRFMSNRKTA